MRALLFLFVSLSAAHAAVLNVTLSPLTLIGNPGQTLTFSGILENTTNDIVFINSNSITFNIIDAGVIDDSLFLTNAPFSLNALESSTTFDFFSVTIPALQAPGPYSGVFTVLGGADELAQDIIGTTGTFGLEVVPAASSNDVPEPASFALMAAGLGLLAWKRRR